MAIQRARRRHSFTLIGNHVYQSGHLSFQAMGLLGYILSKPDNWRISPSQLATVTSETAKKTGRDGVYVILRELKDAGYIKTRKHASGELDYVIYDEPDTANPDMENTDKNIPEPEKPDQEKPDVAFQTLINTDLVINTDQKQDGKSKPKKKIAQKLDFSCWPTLPDPQVLNDWKTLRKGKRAAITQTVLSHMGKVMHRAGNELGLSVDAVLRICISRGWQGCEFEWLANHIGHRHSSPSVSQGVNYIGTDFTPPAGWEWEPDGGRES
ncbi:hypothetical protein [Vibrio spartinae]|uniref:Phage replication protein O n=1 Tax=Vibrio spartinae TaxID=1918945 RepID=A0A1N6M9N2_9VIBR|nr:hypothetical protein [Vibrio spartinae]SIO96111.1 hypothetical protein VSP9026_03871 [Vibrio spartinae]